MLEYFPALEAAFDYSKKSPLILLCGYQTPEAIRRIGPVRLAAWLKKRGCRGSANVARKAVDAANAQRTTLREGKAHKQALIALARRRLNVLWAMLSNHTPYLEPLPDTPTTT